MAKGENVKEILYRDHRGGLDESLKTTITVKTVEDIKSHISKTLDMFGQEIESISFKHVGFDDRTGWDTHNVIFKYKGEQGEFVAGMVNGIPESTLSSSTTPEQSEQIFSEFDIKAWGSPEKVVSNFEKSNGISARKKAWEREIQAFLKMSAVDASKQIKIYKMAEKVLNDTYITVYNPKTLDPGNRMYDFSINYGGEKRENYAKTEENKISLFNFLEIALKLA